MSGTADDELTELQRAHLRIEELEQQIRELQLSLDVTGSIDQRTGLRNRNALIDAIVERRQWLQREQEPFGVMLIALPPTVDGVHAAALLEAALRDVDRVSSWGEWALGAVLPGLEEHNIPAVATRVRRSLELGQIVPLRLVFGISAEYPADLLVSALESGADVAPGTTIVEA